MTDIVHKWELYCQTEASLQTVWSPEEPTACPNNSDHSISTNPGPRIIDTINNNNVKLIEENQPTQGYYQFKGFKKEIPEANGMQNVITTHSFSWPFKITLLNSWFYPHPDSVGDVIDVTVGANTTIGVITSNVASTDTSWTINPDALQYLAVGNDLHLYNGFEWADGGKIININSENSTVTVEKAPGIDFTRMATQVKLSVRIVESLYINEPGVRYAFAEKKIGGKTIPSNIPITVQYHNFQGNAKPLYFNVEFMY